MASRPPTFDHLSKKPLEQTVDIILDDTPLTALREARAALTEAEAAAQQTYDRKLALVKHANPPASELLTIEEGLDRERQQAVAGAQATVAAAENAVREATQTFVFRSIGRKAFEDMIAEHAPSDDDHDEVRTSTGRPEALARWHQATFVQVDLGKASARARTRS
jgi:flagellar biosynthesis GTPase FlhF